MSAPNNRAVTILRWASILLIAVSFIVIVRVLPFDKAATLLNDWISGLGVWGPVVLALMYIVATVLFVPGTILTLAAGAIFGLGTGFVVVSIGSTIGAALAFLIARYFAREKVAAMASRNRRFGAIDKAIEEGGWKIVALLRLSPAIPFNLQNYLYGLTAVRFWPYVLTSWVAMLPGTFLYVYLGHVTGAALGGDRERSPAEWAMLAVGLLATIAVTVYVTRLARNKLNEQMKNTPDQEAEALEDKPAENKQPSIGSTLALATVALLMLGAAGYVYANTDSISKSITGLFGPPAVEMKEAFVEKEAGPHVDHAAFNALLKAHVDADGWVDYGAIKQEEPKLDAYLQALADAPFDDLGRDDKLALLINAYNAFTLKLIVDHWPLESIMDIPEAERWDAKRWRVGEYTWSLNQIEHEIIRPQFIEPRIHFALVCAAVGCPPLRSEAYDPSRLDEQLESQTQYVHQHDTWFAFSAEKKKARLTQLYDWYSGDFDQSAGSPLAFAAQYAPTLQTSLDAANSPEIIWLPYDWKLNSQGNKQPR